MTGRTRRNFSAQFKAEAVQSIVQFDRPIAEVLDELDINPGTPGNWVNKYREEHPEPEQSLTPKVHARSVSRSSLYAWRD